MSIAPSPTASTSNSEAGSTEQIVQFVSELSDTMTQAVREIKEVNSQTVLLSLNAKIEAHRAGSAGAAFGVVANEMQKLADKTTLAADDMENRGRSSINDLLDQISTNIRGSRLSDLALTNIDLVDRNLYERTCDVRWWATDSSLVDALTSSSEEGFAYASKRLGVILDAYTVYHDLVLADLNGRIVANGRPTTFQSQGSIVNEMEWFRQAKQSSSGEEYGFMSATRSPLVNRASVLTYSCGVRTGGEANGKLLGVLGVLFDWESFAQTIVNQTPIAPSEKDQTRCVLCDDDGLILADSHGKQLDDRINVKDIEELMRRSKGFANIRYSGRDQCVAHALSPGFETYRTGWHSLIFQSDAPKKA